MPGGYEGVKLHLKLGSPLPDKQIDVAAVKKAFPYGSLLEPIEVVQGAPLRRALRQWRSDALRRCVVMTCARAAMRRACRCAAGGLACGSGVFMPQMGDSEDAMVCAVAAVTVGH